MIAFTFALLAALVSAAPSGPVVRVREPPVSLAFSRMLNISGTRLPDHDRARAAHQLEVGKSIASGGKRTKRQVSFGVVNEAVTYVANVGVGTPPTNFSLIIDTGSSNTWVGAGKHFSPTSSSQITANVVTVTYGSGFFAGTEVMDTVTLTKELVITGQSIGSALISEGFEGVDGILGIGPTDLTEGTLVPSVISTVPTVTDNLFKQGKISQEVVGVFFAPTTSDPNANGELTFGEIDATKTVGDVTFVPITSTSPSSEFFGIDQQIAYGSNRTTILSSTAGVVDTGTTLVLLATDAFNEYMTLTGATEDATTGLLTISPENFANLQSLFFTIGGTEFELTKNAQTWPRALNADIGGDANSIFLIVSDLGVLGGSGMDFINGMTFLERFYSVFDSTNNRVGFAKTAHTFDETN